VTEVEGLVLLRERLDAVDSRLASTVLERLRLCDEIGRRKRDAGVAMMAPARVRAVVDRYVTVLTAAGVRGRFARALAGLLVDEACAREAAIVEEPASLRLLTLGPAGSDHEVAAQAYLDALGVSATVTVELTLDLLGGMQRLAAGAVDLVLQNSAHPEVHLATERTHPDTVVVDAFVWPTKEMAVLRRSDVDQPCSLGLVPATAGYLDPSAYARVVEEPSKPLVAQGLLEGRYEAGLTHVEHAERSGGQLVVERTIGRVVTAWVVYGRVPRYDGELIGTGGTAYVAGLAAAAGDDRS
jgi:chorismate mutase